MKKISMYCENSLIRSYSFHQVHSRLTLWRKFPHLEKFKRKIYLRGKFEGTDQIEKMRKYKNT